MKAWVEKFRRHSGKVLLLSAAAVLLVLLLFFRSRGLGKTVVSIIEAAHAPDIKRLKDEIADKKSELGEGSAKVKKLERELAEIKADLKTAYDVVDLSDEERRKRWKELDL